MVSQALDAMKSQTHTGVDGEVKNVDEADSPNDGDDVNSLGLGTDFEDGKEVPYNLLSPCQQNKRYDCRDSASDDKWSSFSPRRATPIALDANIRLDQCTRQWAGDPDKGEQRLADT